MIPYNVCLVVYLRPLPYQHVVLPRWCGRTTLVTHQLELSFIQARMLLSSGFILYLAYVCYLSKEVPLVDKVFNGS